MASSLGIEGIKDAAVIGRGGSALVYKARQPGLDRWVAIKVLATTSESGRKRFDRERRAMGRLSQHPGIVTIFASGVTVERQPYLMMPYFEQGSLEKRVEDNGPIEPEEAARLIAIVAQTTADAHDRGLLHRDLKPANILLRGDGMPLIADFGMARLVDQPTLSTAVGHTPAYSAPEIVTGHDATQASDIYGLGATLFALLAGHAPFTQGGERVSLAELADRITLEHVAAERPAGVPDAIWAVVESAMAKAPADRPVDAREIANALDIARGQTPAAVVGSTRPRRTLVGIGAVIAAVIVAVVAMAAIRTGDKEASPSTTMAALRTPPTAAGEATTTSASTTTTLAPTTTRAPVAEEARIAIRVGGLPQTPVFASGSVWVVRNEPDASGALIRIDPQTAAIEETIPLGLHPHGLLHVGDELWVNNVGDGTLSIVDLLDRSRPTVMVDVGVEPQPQAPSLPAAVDPHQLLAAHDAVWVPDVAGGAIVKVDPASKEPLATTDVGNKATSPMAFDGVIWVAAQGLCGSRPCAELHRVDPQSGRIIDTIGFGEAVLDAGTPGAGAGGLWVPLSSGILAKIDVETLEFSDALDFGGSIGTPVSAGDELWVGLGSAGQLACIPESCVIDRIEIGSSVTMPVIAGGLVYAGDPDVGVLFGIDRADGTVSREIPSDVLLQPPLVDSTYLWLATVGQVTRVHFGDST